MKSELTISILSCGFIGEALAVRLQASGYCVRGASRDDEKLQRLDKVGISTHRISVEEEGLIGDWETFLEADVLIFNLPPSKIADKSASLVSLAEKIKQSSIQKVLFLSSISVYPNPPQKIEEELFTQAATARGQRQLDLEQWMLSCIDQECYTVLRLGGLVGGHRQAGRFLAGRKNVSDGNAYVYLIHREDVLGICQRIIEKAAWGKVYHAVADQDLLTKTVFYTKASQELGLEAATFDCKNSTSVYKLLSSSKLRGCLNYKYKYVSALETLQDETIR